MPTESNYSGQKVTQRPGVLITRRLFPEVQQRLGEHFELRDNPDDVVWSPAELIERLQGQWGVLATQGDRIDASVLAACPDLRVVANMAVGYNNLDLDALERHGVQASNTPDVLTESTADFGLALLLATARRITEGERYLRAGRWKQWAADMLLGAEVHHSTLGILGMGRIGQAIARRAAHGFAMQVIYHNRNPLDATTERACAARWVSKAELLRQSDHLLLVLPYTPANHHAIGAAELAQMKPSATLVNLARGGIVDELALAQALQSGQLAAAGLDVYEGEPQVRPELLALINVVLTPHIASATRGTRLAMALLAADNLIAFHEKGEILTPIKSIQACNQV
ncbi:2-hydroxyacid dehydrogenase [Serpentinimonas maccroryi]|uniref:2-hydroxyacid dehydrogenase n=1 Tax=Serpentinimonas maccroryi TaxID=1458426 RepID=UPI0005F08064|nr:D-glycerate dehydrogenase [Serpentinimonas maccroryi]